LGPAAQRGNPSFLYNLAPDYDRVFYNEQALLPMRDKGLSFKKVSGFYRTDCYVPVAMADTQQKSPAPCGTGLVEIESLVEKTW
jgi:hypothetical protein